MAGAFAVGDGPADGELAAHRSVALVTDVGQECLRAARGVRSDQHRAAMAVLIRDLGQRLVEHGDVVGGGVRAGVAATQHTGEELAGVVTERHQRVIAEGPLERRRSLLLLAVADHDRGVEVDDQHVHVVAGDFRGRERPAVAFGVLVPDHLPSPRPRRRHGLERGVVEAVE